MAQENNTLPMEKINPSLDNPRRTITPVDVETIKQQGIVERITVRPHPTKPGEYEIVTGHRRWKGAQEAGLEEIPAQIVQLSDTEVRVRQMIENLQREDLNDVEQGRVFLQLNREEPYWTPQEIADHIGKSQRYVQDRIDIVTDLEPEIQREIEMSMEEADDATSIGISKARALARLPRDEQLKLAKRIKEEGMYRDELLQAIRQGERVEKEISKVRDPELRRELREDYLNVKYDSGVEKEVEERIQIAKGEPDIAPRDKWRHTISPIRRIYADNKDSSELEMWEEDETYYLKLLLWMEK